VVVAAWHRSIPTVFLATCCTSLGFSLSLAITRLAMRRRYLHACHVHMQFHMRALCVNATLCRCMSAVRSWSGEDLNASSVLRCLPRSPSSGPRQHPSVRSAAGKAWVSQDFGRQERAAQLQRGQLEAHANNSSRVHICDRQLSPSPCDMAFRDASKSLDNPSDTRVALRLYRERSH
jgi:hypothetical protein